MLGPAEEGGYWLIGLSRELLRATGALAAERHPLGRGTGARQHAGAGRPIAGVSTMLLGERNDLDQLTDLRPWLG